MRPSLHWHEDCGAHGHTRTARGPIDEDFCGGGGAGSCCFGEDCSGGTGLLVRVVGDVVVVVVVVISHEACFVVDDFLQLAVNEHRGGHIKVTH